MTTQDKERSITSEIQLKNILDKMIEGVQIISFDWKHAYVNDAVVKQSHYTKEELLGYTMMERYPGIEQTKVFRVLKQCMDTRLPCQVEIDFEFPEDKRVAWFELSIQPVPEGIFILSIEVTERKNAQNKIHALNQELELKVNERTAQLENKVRELNEIHEQLETINKDLESFSYSISHDLRAPLRSIIGYAQALEEDLGAIANDAAMRNVSVIQKNALKMNNLINDLLAFSKFGKVDLFRSEVNTKALVENCLSSYNSVPENVRVVIKELYNVYADREMLLQVWVNLISNALKYSSKAKEPLIEIGAQKNDSEIVFFIKDNGAGFDMQYADKLFEVFQRLHSAYEYEGTGVGLSIVKRIVNRHGGKVWAEAEPGKGATFYFSLPRVEVRSQE